MSFQRPNICDIGCHYSLAAARSITNHLQLKHVEALLNSSLRRPMRQWCPPLAATTWATAWEEAAVVMEWRSPGQRRPRRQGDCSSSGRRPPPGGLDFKKLLLKVNEVVYRVIAGISPGFHEYWAASRSHS